MKLPAPIQEFFDADKGVENTPPVSAFSPEAVVKDEGKTYVGLEAIETWWRAAKAKYQQTAVPVEVVDQGGLTVVRAEVTGQFPGSPAVLGFAFRLEDRRILALEISA